MSCELRFVLHDLIKIDFISQMKTFRVLLQQGSTSRSMYDTAHRAHQGLGSRADDPENRAHKGSTDGLRST